MIAHRLSGLPWVLVCVLAVSCGDSSGPDDGDWVETVLSGVVYLDGPVRDATVEVYGLRGAQRGLLFGSATCANDGSYTLELGSKYSDLLVEVCGSDFCLTRLLPGVEPGQKIGGVAVTPITSLATSLALWLTGSEAQNLESAWALAQELVYAHFGGQEHGSLVPMPLEDAEGDPSPEVVAGLLIAGLASQARAMKSTASLGEYLGLLADDVRADGLFDGRGGAGRLALGAYVLDADTLRGDLARDLYNTLESRSDESGISPERLSDLLESIEQDESAIFPPTRSRSDWEPPEIAFLEPAAGQLVSGLQPVRLALSDEHPVVELRVTAPAGLDGVLAGLEWTGVLDTTGLDDGEQVLRVEALDRFRNLGQAELTVQVDNYGLLSGVVFKGPVAQATVSAYALDDAGQKGELLASGLTDETGAYSLRIDRFEGALLLEALQGAYLEEAVGTPVTFGQADRLAAVVPAYSSRFQGTVTLSPLTTWAAELFGWYVRQQHWDVGSAASRANQAISDHFGGLDVLGTLPADLTAEQPVCESLTERVRYGLYLAGLSQLAKRVSLDSGLTPGALVNAISLTGAIASDLQDGVFDGLGSSGRIAQGTYDLSSYTLRADLARAVLAWLSSDRNRCPLGASDFLERADELAMDVTDLFPPDEPPLPVDVGAPVISFESHIDNQPVSGDFDVVAIATDNDELAVFELVNPAGLGAFCEVVDPHVRRLTFHLDTTVQAQGRFPMLYRAVDRSGNATEAWLNLVVDNTPPDVTFESAGRVLPATAGSAVFRHGPGPGGGAGCGHPGRATGRSARRPVVQDLIAGRGRAGRRAGGGRSGRQPCKPRQALLHGPASACLRAGAGRVAVRPGRLPVRQLAGRRLQRGPGRPGADHRSGGFFRVGSDLRKNGRKARLRRSCGHRGQQPADLAPALFGQHLPAESAHSPGSPRLRRPGAFCLAAGLVPGWWAGNTFGAHLQRLGRRHFGLFADGPPAARSSGDRPGGKHLEYNLSVPDFADSRAARSQRGRRLRLPALGPAQPVGHGAGALRHRQPRPGRFSVLPEPELRGAVLPVRHPCRRPAAGARPDSQSVGRRGAFESAGRPVVPAGRGAPDIVEPAGAHLGGQLFEPVLERLLSGRRVVLRPGRGGCRHLLLHRGLRVEQSGHFVGRAGPADCGLAKGRSAGTQAGAGRGELSARAAFDLLPLHRLGAFGFDLPLAFEAGCVLRRQRAGDLPGSGAAGRLSGLLQPGANSADQLGHRGAGDVSGGAELGDGFSVRAPAALFAPGGSFGRRDGRLGRLDGVGPGPASGRGGQKPRAGLGPAGHARVCFLGRLSRSGAAHPISEGCPWSPVWAIRWPIWEEWETCSSRFESSRGAKFKP